MGKSPKVPAAPPPSPTAPDFASAFAGRGQRNAMAGGMGGTFLTQGQQPLLSMSRKKTVLG